MTSKRLGFDVVESEIRRRNFGVLATVCQDGRPHSTGVLYGVSPWEKLLAIYITTNRESKKARNVARNPNVSFTIPLSRRYLRLLPPHCVQFQGTADTVPIEDETANEAFGSLLLREVLKLERKHVQQKAVFIRIHPDPVIFTYGLGLSFVELMKHIGAASSRVRIPSPRLHT